MADARCLIRFANSDLHGKLSPVATRGSELQSPGDNIHHSSYSDLTALFPSR